MPLDGDRPLLGTWVKLPAVEVVEILALAGLDFVIIDTEHAPLGPGDVSRLVAMGSALGLASTVRVSDTSPSAIARVCDLGAAGLVLPHVDSAEQAAAIVDSMRFPPDGHRGSGRMSRSGAWGALSRDEYLQRGRDVRCIPQIESLTAVADIDRIVAVDGVDAVFLGAGDLSMEMGAMPGSPQVQEQLDRVRRACADAGMPWGAAANDGEGARRQIDSGASFVTLSNDTSALSSAIRGMVAPVRDGAS